MYSKDNYCRMKHLIHLIASPTNKCPRTKKKRELKYQLNEKEKISLFSIKQDPSETNSRFNLILIIKCQ